MLNLVNGSTVFGLPALYSSFLMLIIASLCGMALGAERAIREKEAGIRTHVILIIGATLFTIISNTFANDSTSDAARIMAQIVPGVGFLGAGIIMFRGEALHGLTTAAGVWTTAGIGMAIGNGMIIIGVFVTALVIVMQLIFHSHMNSKRNHYRYLHINFVCGEDTLAYIKETFEIKKFGRLKLRNDGGQIIADAVFRTNANCDIDRLAKIVNGDKDIIVIERLDITQN